MILEIKGKKPCIGKNTFIADDAVVAGDVTIGDNCSIWFGAVIRAESDSITIGNNTNIQDNCVLHCDEGSPLKIGDNVTVGHSAVVHGCTVGNNCLIGISSTILNDAVIGEYSLVGAGALVTERKQFDPGQLIVGSPAVAKMPLSEKHKAIIDGSAGEYVELKEFYK